MGLTVQEKGGSIELIEEGTYPATCFQVIDLGTQESEFDGVANSAHKVLFGFVIPELSYEYEDKESGKKRTGYKTITARFTASLSNKATLTGFLNRWRGKKFTDDELKGFDLKKVLGANCMLQVVHSKDGKWANVESCAPLYKGIEVGKTDKEPLAFEMDVNAENLYDEDIYAKLPEFLQDTIAKSLEFKKFFGIESIEDQEENMKVEAEVQKKKQSEANAEEATSAFE